MSTTLSLFSLATVEQELLENPASQSADTATQRLSLIWEPSGLTLFSLSKLSIGIVYGPQTSPQRSTSSWGQGAVPGAQLIPNISGSFPNAVFHQI